MLKERKVANTFIQILPITFLWQNIFQKWVALPRRFYCKIGIGSHKKYLKITVKENAYLNHKDFLFTGWPQG